MVQDTAIRIIDPKYYGGTQKGVEDALEEFRARGCKFIVAGRTTSEGNFEWLGDLQLSPAISDLFIGLTESEFRLDLSSSEIRAKAKGQT